MNFLHFFPFLLPFNKNLCILLIIKPYKTLSGCPKYQFKPNKLWQFKTCKFLSLAISPFTFSLHNDCFFPFLLLSFSPYHSLTLSLSPSVHCLSFALWNASFPPSLLLSLTLSLLSSSLSSHIKQLGTVGFQESFKCCL